VTGRFKATSGIGQQLDLTDTREQTSAQVSKGQQGVVIAQPQPVAQS